MQVGQQLGPFLIEKELGSGAMGTVYRGRYTKTGQVMAIKVMSPGLGTNSPTSVSRFEAEAEILKQLKHPNIVRIYGVGKSQGVRYFAMEYIEGQSLDRVMARRDRMTWEEVVDLGKQLCSALEHCHKAGIVHRDLKPSNLMILADGTLKLTDFGIAKDLDETALTGTNCTVGTAAYMSPEQCRGERHLTPKTDLYSLGVVFYELLTGRKPFVAENAVEMFMLHVQGKFERPSRLVLDLPIWLDNLVCQLLEKKPEQRPLTAALVGEVLDTIQEKVEAQQSAGVEAARARLMDRTRGPRNPTEEDKDAARTLLTGRGRKRSRKKPRPLYKQLWLQAAGLLLLFAGVLTALVLALRPPSPDALFQKAAGLMQSKDPEDRNRAREGPIKEYLRRYRGVPGEQTRQIQEWADELDAARQEKLLDRYLRWERNRQGFRPAAQSDADKLAFEAGKAEDEGDKARADKLWREVADKAGGTGWDVVARRHLGLLGRVAQEDARLEGLLEDVRRSGREPEPAGLERLAFTAARARVFGDHLLARRWLEELKRSAAEQPVGEESPEQESARRFWRLFASVRLKEVNAWLETHPEKAADRLNRVRQRVKDVEKKFGQPNVREIDLRRDCLDVVALYGDEKDAEFQEAVKDARTLLEKLRRRT
jgi:serine/threonine-protein kinase